MRAYIGKSTRMPFLHCPACGNRIDGATGVSLDEQPIRPKAGNFSVCLYCATLLIFEENVASLSRLGVRRAAACEAEAMRSDPQQAELLTRMLAAARALRRSRIAQGQG
jgi:hypothetical protein